MSDKQLGRLQKVELREAWLSESSHFTPWLARCENLELLGEAIGIQLECEAQEKNVGPFRADILCKDTATDHWVLIENQLERTDHNHLGQLLTYAAGLEAVTIVWIAERFTDEHRAALDWLNQHTDEGINFFGLEVELWRIGTSPLAPKFNVVSKPNEWTRSVAESAKHLESGELSETKQMQKEFWAGFAQQLERFPGVLRPTKPLPQHWMNLAIGRAGFKLLATCNTRDGHIGACVVMRYDAAKTSFNAFKAQQAAIEKEFGEALEWEELPGKKESRIGVSWSDIDPTDRKRWSDYNLWLQKQLEQLHRVFSPRIRALDLETTETEEEADGLSS
jgi:hypothetical protein